MLSTNAGGNTTVRYGNARELCLGLEVVLPDGEIWHGLRGLRKDNSGYDLRDLFIGSEGTLGVITRLVLRLYPKPRSVNTALAALPGSALAATTVLGAVMAVGWRGDVVRIAGHAVTRDLAVDLGAPLAGVFVLLQDQHARTFAHDEAVAVLVPGARGLGGTVVEAGGKGTGGTEAGHADLGHRGFRAAGHPVAGCP